MINSFARSHIIRHPVTWRHLGADGVVAALFINTSVRFYWIRRLKGPQEAVGHATGITTLVTPFGALSTAGVYWGASGSSCGRALGHAL